MINCASSWLLTRYKQLLTIKPLNVNVANCNTRPAVWTTYQGRFGWRGVHTYRVEEECVITVDGNLDREPVCEHRNLEFEMSWIVSLCLVFIRAGYLRLSISQRVSSWKYLLVMDRGGGILNNLVLNKYAMWLLLIRVQKRAHWQSVVKTPISHMFDNVKAYTGVAVQLHSFCTLSLNSDEY